MSNRLYSQLGESYNFPAVFIFPACRSAFISNREAINESIESSDPLKLDDPSGSNGGKIGQPAGRTARQPSVPSDHLPSDQTDGQPACLHMIENACRCVCVYARPKGVMGVIVYLTSFKALLYRLSYMVCNFPTGDKKNHEIRFLGFNMMGLGK